MLSWCAYCQQLIDEVPPYEDFSITHGICAECADDEDALFEDDLSGPLILKGFQERLFKAGRHADLEELERIIDDCQEINIRYIDILIGLIAPSLYQIGEDWEKGTVTVADEHRFTSFCEKAYEIIAARIYSSSPDDSMQTGQLDVLLINAPENRHTLGIRIIRLWLLSNGSVAEAVVQRLNVEEILTLVRTKQPRYLLISMALAEQKEEVIAIAECIAALPAKTRPKIIVGGHAVKLGFAKHIPNCKLITNLGGMSRFLLEGEATESGL